MSISSTKSTIQMDGYRYAIINNNSLIREDDGTLSDKCITIVIENGPIYKYIVLGVVYVLNVSWDE